jgi:acid phosphatase (class A)
VDLPTSNSDLQLVRTAVQSRTDAEIAHAQADDLRSVFRFTDIMGPNFRPENLPFATQLFQHVHENGNAITFAAKSHFQRQRPLCRRSRYQDHRGAGAGLFLSEQSFDLRL